MNYPDFKDANQPKRETSIWRHRRANYLREFHATIYYAILCKMILADYLERIDKQAKEMYDKLIKEFAEKQCITEQLKTNNIANQIR